MPDQALADAEVLKQALGLRSPEFVGRYRDFAQGLFFYSKGSLAHSCSFVRSERASAPLDGSTAQDSHICLRLLKLRVVRRGFSIGAATSLGLATSTELLALATVSTIDG